MLKNKNQVNDESQDVAITPNASNNQNSMNIKLTFVNESNDMNNSDVVIFQKNALADPDEDVVAWTVIKNCRRNCSHTFVYPMGFSIGASDFYGNVSNLQEGEFGQQWNIARSVSGDTVQLSQTPASHVNQVELANHLPVGTVNAQIYKDGKLLLVKTGISPEQKAVFSYEPKIWIGVVSHVNEGQMLDTAIMKSITTEISLLGIRKAAIIMTGGGFGPNAAPFEFDLNATA